MGYNTIYKCWYNNKVCKAFCIRKVSYKGVWPTIAIVLHMVEQTSNKKKKENIWRQVRWLILMVQVKMLSLVGSNVELKLWSSRVKTHNIFS